MLSNLLEKYLSQSTIAGFKKKNQKVPFEKMPWLQLFCYFYPC